MVKNINSKQLEKEIKLLLEKYDKQKNMKYLINIENLFEIYLKENRDANEIALRFVIFLFEDIKNCCTEIDFI